jgi:hypothetical protein
LVLVADLVSVNETGVVVVVAAVAAVGGLVVVIGGRRGGPLLVLRSVGCFCCSQLLHES